MIRFKNNMLSLCSPCLCGSTSGFFVFNINYLFFSAVSLLVSAFNPNTLPSVPLW
jgi:hypothetical protein